MSRATSELGTVVKALAAGDPVLVYDADDREGETDIVYAAETVTAADVAHMRNYGGGLVCVAVAYEVAEAFNLPYLDLSIDHPASDDLELGYDDRSSFSLSVNHRDTYTGVTDRDRARTIRALAAAADEPEGTVFAAEFRAPGHVSILKGAPDGLADRTGHTEMGIALARRAGCAPAAVVCEMLDDYTGDALAKERAKAYAAERGYPFLEGSEILEELA